jgi:hypothetical protein
MRGHSRTTNEKIRQKWNADSDSPLHMAGAMYCTCNVYAWKGCPPKIAQDSTENAACGQQQQQQFLRRASFMRGFASGQTSDFSINKG